MKEVTATNGIQEFQQNKLIYSRLIETGENY
jgi:hypothetical protein